MVSVRVNEKVSPPAKLLTPIAVLREDCIEYGDSVWATRPVIVELKVLMILPFESHVDTVKLSIGSVVGGANNPYIPIVKVLLANNALDRKLEIFTSFVE